jgi:hypothetical protein
MRQFWVKHMFITEKTNQWFLAHRTQNELGFDASGNLLVDRTTSYSEGPTLVRTTTAYNTSSDYRLKEDTKPVLNPIDRLMQLNPINFAWKADGSPAQMVF